MSSERLWIVILAAVTFLVGTAAGLLIAPSLLAPRDRGPFATYQVRLAEEFDFSAEQRRKLRSVLEEYERRLEKVEARFLNQTEMERAEIGLECRDTIRQVVLDQADRRRFDAMESGLILPGERLEVRG